MVFWYSKVYMACRQTGQKLLRHVVHLSVLRETAMAFCHPWKAVVIGQDLQQLEKDIWKVRKDPRNYRLIGLTWKDCERIFWRLWLNEHMKNRQVAGNSQHGFSKDKSCLTTLPAFCAGTTGSVNKGRAMLTDKAVTWSWSQSWPLREAISNQLPVGLGTSDHKPFSLAIQSAFHPPHSSLTCFSSLALRMLSRLQWRPSSSQEATGTGCNKGSPDQIKGNPNLTGGLVARWDSGTPILGDAHNTATQGSEQPDLREPCSSERMDQTDERHPDRSLPSQIIVWSILWCMCLYVGVRETFSSISGLVWEAVLYLNSKQFILAFSKGRDSLWELIFSFPLLFWRCQDHQSYHCVQD